MELCDTILEEIIDEMIEDSNLSRNDSLTLLSYYIASYIFIEILEGVNHLHQKKSANNSQRFETR